MITLCNAFSLNMLPLCTYEAVGVHIEKTDLAVVKKLLGIGGSAEVLSWQSAVGHADTARILGDLLGIAVPVQRVDVTFQAGDTLVIGQYTGPRLPEGTTELPPGARIDWYIVQR